MKWDKNVIMFLIIFFFSCMGGFVFFGVRYLVQEYVIELSIANKHHEKEYLEFVCRQFFYEEVKDRPPGCVKYLKKLQYNLNAVSDL